MIFPAILTVIHAVDGVMTWIYGRNTEYGLVFKSLIHKGPTVFFSARFAFTAAIVLACMWFNSYYKSQALYWLAIGAQFQAVLIIARAFFSLACVCAIGLLAIVVVAICGDFLFCSSGMLIMALYSLYAKGKR